MIAIIDYNSGNIASVKNALDRLKFKYEVVCNAKDLCGFDKVIFPGVGRASSAMEELKKRDFVDAIKKLKVPFLGICLGLQLLADFTEEDNTECLSIIPGRVKRFSGDVKIPQIGWNRVAFVQDSPLFEGIEDGSYFYFVNSYYFAGGTDIEGSLSYLFSPCSNMRSLICKSLFEIQRRTARGYR